MNSSGVKVPAVLARPCFGEKGHHGHLSKLCCSERPEKNDKENTCFTFYMEEF